MCTFEIYHIRLSTGERLFACQDDHTSKARELWLRHWMPRCCKCTTWHCVALLSTLLLYSLLFFRSFPAGLLLFFLCCLSALLLCLSFFFFACAFGASFARTSRDIFRSFLSFSCFIRCSLPRSDPWDRIAAFADALTTIYIIKYFNVNLVIDLFCMHPVGIWMDRYLTYPRNSSCRAGFSSCLSANVGRCSTAFSMTWMFCRLLLKLPIHTWMRPGPFISSLRSVIRDGSCRWPYSFAWII